MNERIIQIRKHLNLTQDALGSKIGITRGAVSKIEKGERGVTEQVILAISREFNINEEWLRTGNGDMFVEPDTFSLDELAKQRGCSGLKLEIVKSLLEMDESDVYKLIKAFKPAYDLLAEEETTATVEVAVSHELSVEQELENYRMELEAVQKGTTSQVLGTGKDKIS